MKLKAINPKLDQKVKFSPLPSAALHSFSDGLETVVAVSSLLKHIRLHPGLHEFGSKEAQSKYKYLHNKFKSKLDDKLYK